MPKSLFSLLGYVLMAMMFLMIGIPPDRRLTTIGNVTRSLRAIPYRRLFVDTPRAMYLSSINGILSVAILLFWPCLLVAVATSSWGLLLEGTRIAPFLWKASLIATTSCILSLILVYSTDSRTS